MNLLDKTKGKDGQTMSTTMLTILKEIALPENYEIAVKFLDFSKELDLTLLENVTFQSLKTKTCTLAQCNSWHLFDKKESNEYIDRYILFLDAMGGNTITSMISHYGLITDLDEEIVQKIFPHALSLRYNETDTKAKIAALIIAGMGFLNLQNPCLNQFAKEDPQILLRATHFCDGQYANDELKLIALALSHIDPKNTSIDKDVIQDYVDYTLRVTEKSIEDVADAPATFIFLMLVCFMSYHHDPRFKKILVEKRDTAPLERFAYCVVCDIDKDYIRENIDELMDILFKDNYDLIPICITHILNREFHLGYTGDTVDEQNKVKACVEPLFTEIAKKYPQEYMKVLENTDSKVNIGNYISMLYDILKNTKNCVLKLKEDIMIQRLISDEKNHCDPSFAPAVAQYLKGEIPLESLSNFFEIMHQKTYSIVSANRWLIDKCLQSNEDFRKRYLAVKCIFGNFAINDLILNDFCTMNHIIQSAIIEKVPIEYRFAAYEYIYSEYYAEKYKNGVWTAVLNMMVKMKDDKDKEYCDYLLNGTAFCRMLYVSYLDQTNDNDCNQATILKLCTDSSAGVRRLAGNAVAKHKNYEPEVLELLKSKKAAVREVGIDILSQWGSKNYAELLKKLAETEKSSKLVDKIQTVLNAAHDTDSDNTDNTSPIQLVEQLTKGGRARKLSWFYTDTFNDKVHFLSGAEAGTKYMQALLLCYAGVDTLGRSEYANILAEKLNQEELNRFAGDVFSAWLDNGAEAKKRWVLYFCAIHGGSSMLEGLLHYIKEWAENSRGAIAADAVKAIALNGTSEALMSIDNLAHKCKFKQVKNAAVQALDSAADALEITSDELGDRIIPDLGFNHGMERIFDYGSRQFKVYLTPTLELEVYDESDKKLKNLPAPAKKDDAEIAKKSNDEFKQMKKQLKSIINIQKMRLETALIADRRWSVAAWTDLFVKNPIMHSFAIGLIWGAYENDTLVQTFRYMEDGTFNTQDEEEYTLPENCAIGLVHPIDLDKDTMNAWKEQLSDYEIVQPIVQLERPVFLINDAEKDQLVLKRYNDKKISGLKLLSRMTKAGWSKGSVQDGGSFFEFYREDITKRVKDGNNVLIFGNAVSLEFSGMYVGYDAEDEDVTIERICFYKPGTLKRGSYVYDEIKKQDMIPLDKVSNRYFSEIITLFESIFKDNEE